MDCHSDCVKSDHGSIWKQQLKISRCIRSVRIPGTYARIVFMEGEKMKLVVNEITEEVGKKLLKLGYTDSSNTVKNHKCFYKEYDIKGRFSLTINPYGEPYNTVAVVYHDDDLEDREEIDECYDMSEIYEDLQLLIDEGIVERR